MVKSKKTSFRKYLNPVYLLGKLHKGETISGKLTVVFITKIKRCLPNCFNQVLICADVEFHDCGQCRKAYG